MRQSRYWACFQRLWWKVQFFIYLFFSWLRNMVAKSERETNNAGFQKEPKTCNMEHDKTSITKELNVVLS